MYYTLCKETRWSGLAFKVGRECICTVITEKLGMKYVVLTVGCNCFSRAPWTLAACRYLSSDKKEYFCLPSLSQSLQPLVPACLLQVFSWQISSTSPFPFYFGFLDHCPPFRKVLGLLCCHCIGYLPWKCWAQGAKGAAFIAAQVEPTPGVEMCCVPWWNQRPLALSLGVPPDCRNFGVFASPCFGHDFPPSVLTSWTVIILKTLW